MDDINEHGLSRKIPENIKRQVRRECGFGCVCCGLAIATYEHIDPPFKDALKHDPARIAYLCGSCHDRVTRGLWSKEKITIARSNPWCIRNDRCHDSFDISAPNPVIWVGPNEIININKILSFDEDLILSIEPPEQTKEPYSISGVFYDHSGNLLFTIVKNEWVGNIDNWDIEAIGRTITVRIGPRRIALRITALPPDGIMIERAAMFYRQTQFTVNEYQARLLTSNEGGVTLRGRRIVGHGPETIFLSAYSTGRWTIGGGGAFSIEGPPKDTPEFIRNRAPLGRNSKCLCGSDRKYKRCCEGKHNGKPAPGKGPMLTFDGIPLR